MRKSLYFSVGGALSTDSGFFFSSTAALSAYFARCAAAGFDLSGRPAPETLEAVRPLGRIAEGAMLEATGGVNTHKGAVFSLGLLAAAACSSMPTRSNRSLKSIPTRHESTRVSTKR